VLLRPLGKSGWRARLTGLTRTQRYTLIAAILGSTVVFLDSTIVNVALPAIAEDLDCSPSSPYSSSAARLAIRRGDG
jgi:hypothetical protein